jgi:hypothetical protein
MMKELRATSAKAQSVGMAGVVNGNRAGVDLDAERTPPSVVPA